MPLIEVTLPDGAVVEVNLPDGADPNVEMPKIIPEIMKQRGAAPAPAAPVAAPVPAAAPVPLLPTPATTRPGVLGKSQITPEAFAAAEAAAVPSSFTNIEALDYERRVTGGNAYLGALRGAGHRINSLAARVLSAPAGLVSQDLAAGLSADAVTSARLAEASGQVDPEAGIVTRTLSGVLGSGAEMLATPGGPIMKTVTMGTGVGNLAYQRARDAGMSEADALVYAGGQGVAEAAPSMILNRVGLGGAESAAAGLLKQDVAKIAARGTSPTKAALAPVAGEVFEEGGVVAPTQYGLDVAAGLEEGSPSGLLKNMGESALQAAFMVPALQAPQVAADEVRDFLLRRQGQPTVVPPAPPAPEVTGADSTLTGPAPIPAVTPEAKTAPAAKRTNKPLPQAQKDIVDGLYARAALLPDEADRAAAEATIDEALEMAPEEAAALLGEVDRALPTTTTAPDVSPSTVISRLDESAPVGQAKAMLLGAGPGQVAGDKAGKAMAPEPPAPSPTVPVGALSIIDDVIANVGRAKDPADAMAGLEEAAASSPEIRAILPTVRRVVETEIARRAKSTQAAPAAPAPTAPAPRPAAPVAPVAPAQSAAPVPVAAEDDLTQDDIDALRQELERGGPAPAQPAAQTPVVPPSAPAPPSPVVPAEAPRPSVPEATAPAPTPAPAPVAPKRVSRTPGPVAQRLLAGEARKTVDAAIQVQNAGATDMSAAEYETAIADVEDSGREGEPLSAAERRESSAAVLRLLALTSRAGRSRIIAALRAKGWDNDAIRERVDLLRKAHSALVSEPEQIAQGTRVEGDRQTNRSLLDIAELGAQELTAALGDTKDGGTRATLGNSQENVARMEKRLPLLEAEAARDKDPQKVAEAADLRKRIADSKAFQARLQNQLDLQSVTESLTPELQREVSDALRAVERAVDTSRRMPLQDRATQGAPRVPKEGPAAAEKIDPEAAGITAVGESADVVKEAPTETAPQIQKDTARQSADAGLAGIAKSLLYSVVRKTIGGVNLGANLRTKVRGTEDRAEQERLMFEDLRRNTGVELLPSGQIARRIDGALVPIPGTLPDYLPGGKYNKVSELLPGVLPGRSQILRTNVDLLAAEGRKAFGLSVGQIQSLRNTFTARLNTLTASDAYNKASIPNKDKMVRTLFDTVSRAINDGKPVNIPDNKLVSQPYLNPEKMTEAETRLDERETFFAKAQDITQRLLAGVTGANRTTVRAIALLPRMSGGAVSDIVIDEKGETRYDPTNRTIYVSKEHTQDIASFTAAVAHELVHARWRGLDPRVRARVAKALKLDKDNAEEAVADAVARAVLAGDVSFINRVIENSVPEQQTDVDPAVEAAEEAAADEDADVETRQKAAAMRAKAEDQKTTKEQEAQKSARASFANTFAVALREVSRWVGEVRRAIRNTTPKSSVVNPKYAKLHEIEGNAKVFAEAITALAIHYDATLTGAQTTETKYLKGVGVAKAYNDAVRAAGEVPRSWQEKIRMLAGRAADAVRGVMSPATRARVSEDTRNAATLNHTQEHEVIGGAAGQIAAAWMNTYTADLVGMSKEQVQLFNDAVWQAEARERLDSDIEAMRGTEKDLDKVLANIHVVGVTAVLEPGNPKPRVLFGAERVQAIKAFRDTALKTEAKAKADPQVATAVANRHRAWDHVRTLLIEVGLATQGIEKFKEYMRHRAIDTSSDQDKRFAAEMSAAFGRNVSPQVISALMERRDSGHPTTTNVMIADYEAMISLSRAITDTRLAHKLQDVSEMSPVVQKMKRRRTDMLRDKLIGKDANWQDQAVYLEHLLKSFDILGTPPVAQPWHRTHVKTLARLRKALEVKGTLDEKDVGGVLESFYTDAMAGNGFDTKFAEDVTLANSDAPSVESMFADEIVEGRGLENYMDLTDMGYPGEVMMFNPISIGPSSPVRKTLSKVSAAMVADVARGLMANNKGMTEERAQQLAKAATRAALRLALPPVLVVPRGAATEIGRHARRMQSVGMHSFWKAIKWVQQKYAIFNLLEPASVPLYIWVNALSNTYNLLTASPRSAKHLPAMASLVHRFNTGKPMTPAERSFIALALQKNVLGGGFSSNLTSGYVGSISKYRDAVAGAGLTRRGLTKYLDVVVPAARVVDDAPRLAEFITELRRSEDGLKIVRSLMPEAMALPAAGGPGLANQAQHKAADPITAAALRVVGNHGNYVNMSETAHFLRVFVNPYITYRLAVLKSAARLVRNVGTNPAAYTAQVTLTTAALYFSVQVAQAIGQSLVGGDDEKEKDLEQALQGPTGQSNTSVAFSVGDFVFRVPFTNRATDLAAMFSLQDPREVWDTATGEPSVRDIYNSQGEMDAMSAVKFGWGAAQSFASQMSTGPSIPSRLLQWGIGQQPRTPVEGGPTAWTPITDTPKFIAQSVGLGPYYNFINPDDPRPAWVKAMAPVAYGSHVNDVLSIHASSLEKSVENRAGLLPDNKIPSTEDSRDSMLLRRALRMGDKETALALAQKLAEKYTEEQAQRAAVGGEVDPNERRLAGFLNGARMSMPLSMAEKNKGIYDNILSPAQMDFMRRQRMIQEQFLSPSTNPDMRDIWYTLAADNEVAVAKSALATLARAAKDPALAEALRLEDAERASRWATGRIRAWTPNWRAETDEDKALLRDYRASATVEAAKNIEVLAPFFR